MVAGKPVCLMARCASSGSLAEPRWFGRWRGLSASATTTVSFTARTVGARAWKVLAGDAVVVPVEPVGIAGIEMFLGFALIGEIGAV